MSSGPLDASCAVSRVFSAHLLQLPRSPIQKTVNCEQYFEISSLIVTIHKELTTERILRTDLVCRRV